VARLDLRINLEFTQHPKTKRLIRKLSFEGFYCLLELWSKAAKLYPKGNLKKCDAEDIADLSGWSGDPEEFVQALLDPKINFLDQNEDGTFEIHDWQTNQPWVYFSEERSAVAKAKAEKRWEKRLNTSEQPEDTEDADSNDDLQEPENDQQSSSNADCMQVASKVQYKVYAGGNAPSPSPSPSPNPSPNPNPNPNPNPEKISGSVDPPPKTEPIPFDRPLPAKDADLKLYHSIEKAFLSRNGEKFTSWGKEGKAIKEIIKKARIRSPDAYGAFIQQMMEKLWELKNSGDRFWSKQPFLPSALNAAGIWDRVLEEFREESSHEMTDEEFEQLVREAAG
jgi:hypothetical protein